MSVWGGRDIIYVVLCIISILLLNNVLILSSNFFAKKEASKLFQNICDTRVYEFLKLKADTICTTTMYGGIAGFIT